MSTLTIRALDDDLKVKLRARAAANGQSMEAEVRQILRDALTAPAPARLGSRIRDRFAEVHGELLEVPARIELARAPELS